MKLSKKTKALAAILVLGIIVSELLDVFLFQEKFSWQLVLHTALNGLLYLCLLLPLGILKFEEKAQKHQSCERKYSPHLQQSKFL